MIIMRGQKVLMRGFWGTFFLSLTLMVDGGEPPSAGLGIQTFAGLTITGAVGTVYSIEYRPDVAETNSANVTCNPLFLAG